MSSDRLPTIRLDDDGYPADETLDQIERYRGDWNALLERNRVFWGECWYSARRGGLYEFKI